MRFNSQIVDAHKVSAIPDSLLKEQRRIAKVASPSFSLGTVLVVGLLASVTAQADYIPTEFLGQVGATDLQQRTGDAVRTVCGKFATDPDKDAFTQNQRDLFDRCREMVHNANAVTEESDGATADSLGLEREQLQAALQNVAGEEGAASGSMATESSTGQVANISKRLSSLLSRSSGLQVSAVNIYGHDALYVLSQEELSILSGGSAGEEGGLLDNRWGIFINGDLGSGEKDGTEGEDGFSFDSTGFTAGVDYRMNNQVVIGVAAGFTSQEADFDSTSTQTVSGGGMDSDSTSFSTYGLFYTDKFFFDGVLTYGQSSFDMDRNILIQTGDTEPGNGVGADRVAVSETDGSSITFSFGGGTEIVSGSFTFAPYARVQYLTVDIDGFEETGADGLNLGYKDQEIDSLTSSVGFRANTVANTGMGVLLPQARLEWVHEFSDDGREVSTYYIHDTLEEEPSELIFETDDPDRDYFNMGLGVSAVFKGGTQAFVDVRTILGLTDFTETTVTAGIRFEL